MIKYVKATTLGQKAVVNKSKCGFRAMKGKTPVSLNLHNQYFFYTIELISKNRMVFRLINSRRPKNYIEAFSGPEAPFLPSMPKTVGVDKAFRSPRQKRND